MRRWRMSRPRLPNWSQLSSVTDILEIGAGSPAAVTTMLNVAFLEARQRQLMALPGPRRADAVRNGLPARATLLALPVVVSAEKARCRAPRTISRPVPARRPPAHPDAEGRSCVRPWRTGGVL